MTAEVVPITKANELVTRIHAYDKPHISAREFLESVMHSPNVSLHLRMDAAIKLIKLEAAEPQCVILHDEAQPLYKIIIGGLPD